MNNKKETKISHGSPVVGQYCTNEGEEVCFADQRLVCKNSRWVSHGYCQSDNTL